MDYGASSGNVVHVIPEPWASEEEYRVWNNVDARPDTPSNSNRSGSEPPNKKSRNTLDSASSSTSARSKAIGKMFFKTKLCCKFRAGTCPYVTNCNFAHSIEELRRPPPNWQEIVAAHEDDKEEFQIPSVVSSGFVSESQRSYKGRHCKKFYTEEGCPYGETCTFLHDEQSKNRESVAISLGPGGYSGGGGGGSGGGSGGGGGGGGNGGGGSVNGNGSIVIAAGAGAILKPSNWKTRICNKWEITGYCPFGSKCHFAHGSAELHHYGGGIMESDSSAAPPNTKQLPSKPSGDTGVASGPSLPHSDVHHIGVPSQRTAIIIHRPMQRVHQKWKGPDKISRIYGDWIDELE